DVGKGLGDDDLRLRSIGGAELVAEGSLELALAEVGHALVGEGETKLLVGLPHGAEADRDAVALHVDEAAALDDVGILARDEIVGARAIARADDEDVLLDEVQAQTER